VGSGGEGVDPLVSQESLILSPNKRWLLAVNAGSNSISVFRIRHDRLKLTGTFDSGGAFPVSLTLFHNLLYVLNAGSDSAGPNITGFRLSHRGELFPLAGSKRELGVGGFHQVGFDPQGDVLVVTEGDPAGENRIHVFSVNRRGLPGPEAVISPSNGIVPFGFIFDHRGHLLVSEAGDGAVTSYKILRNNTLRVISPSVANDQSATCWIAGNSMGFVYTANTGSDTISAYKLRSGKGRLVLLDQAAGFGNKPIDMTTAGNGRFLYVLNANDGTVGMFRIKRNGSLKDLGVIGGLPSPYAQGIAGN
jgi:6-phosphogluconolactonase (cycloisomerase 2 family)